MKMTKRFIGAFTAGEVPPPLQISFLDYDGDVVNLTGFTVTQMNIEERSGLPVGDGVIVVANPAEGLVTYTWDRPDMEAPGRYTAQAWVSNGTLYFGSDWYLYSVHDGPGDPPA